MKKVLLTFALLALVVGVASATSFPPGDFRGNLTDRTSLFNENNANHAGLDPVAFGVIPVVGDENRSVFQVTAVNFGQKDVDGAGVTQIVDQNPQVPLGGYSNGALTGMFYDINIGAPGTSIPAAGPTILNPWILFFTPGTRYTNAGGTTGTWTDTVPGTGGFLATTAAGFGGLIVVYDQLPINTDYKGTGGGPSDWTEGTIANPDPSLSASDAFPTISDVSPWLVMALGPLPAPYQSPAGTAVSLEVLTGFDNRGLAFGNIIGGTAADEFQKDVFGLGLDVRFEFTPIIGTGPIDNGWQLRSTDPVQFSVFVPEPATLSLLGLGLAGLAGLLRKRRQK